MKWFLTGIGFVFIIWGQGQLLDYFEITHTLTRMLIGFVVGYGAGMLVFPCLFNRW
jgi:hypothetical protein